MSNLHGKLLHLFPNYKEGDWVIGETYRRGPAIEAWNRPEPRPDAAAIAAVTDEQATAALRERAFERDFELTKRERAIILLIAARTSATPAQIRAQLKSIWESLQ